MTIATTTIATASSGQRADNDRPTNVATRPNHAPPGASSPAAVIGCAHPTIPIGGIATKTIASTARNTRCRRENNTSQGNVVNADAPSHSATA